MLFGTADKMLGGEHLHNKGLLKKLEDATLT